MGQRRRILVVDGSKYFDSLIWRMLIPEVGFELVGLARNPDEALEMADTRHPDIVLLDISHSKTRGLGAIEALHLAQPAVPIVAFTPISSDQYTQAAFEAGASACFAKSEIANVLLKTMGSLISNPVTGTGHLLSQGVGL